MTKVLQVLGQSAGGVGRHVARVTEALNGTRGLHIDVAAPADLRVAMPVPIIPVTIPSGPVRGHRRAVAALRRIIAMGSYDVVHAHGLRAGIDAGLAARGSRARLFYTVHNLIHPDIAGRAAAIYRRAEPIPVKLSDKTFAASEEIARRLAASVPRAHGKIEVLHLGVGETPQTQRSRAEVRDELDLDASTRLMVTVARLAPQKALHVMLQALTRLPTDVALAIIGGGPLEGELRVLADRLGVGARTHLLGYKDAPFDYVAAADVFCLTSVWEAVALAAQEAVQLGVPVVSTDVGGMRELIEDRTSGRLVPAGDPDALATALLETLDDPARAASYVSTARERLAAGFSTEAMLARLERAYLETTL